MSAYIFVAVGGGSLGLLRRRRPHPGAQLALDLLHQPPDRRLAFFSARSSSTRTRGLGLREGRRLPRARSSSPARSMLGDLCRRQERASTGGLGAHARVRWASRSPCSSRSSRSSPGSESDHAAAHPPHPRLVGSSVVRGFLVTGPLVHVLPRRAVPRAHPRLRRLPDRPRLHGDERRARCDVRRDLGGPSGGRASVPSGPWSVARKRSRRAADLLAGGCEHTCLLPRDVRRPGALRESASAPPTPPPLMMIALEDVPAADAGLAWDHPGLDPALGRGRTGRARHYRHRAGRIPSSRRASRVTSALSERLPPRLSDRRRRRGGRDPDRALRPRLPHAAAGQRPRGIRGGGSGRRRGRIGRAPGRLGQP